MGNELQNSKMWPYIHGLIYSEVSYLATVNRVNNLRAIKERSIEENESLRQLEGSPASDLKVMTIWIERLKEMGFDFLSDHRIPEIRQNLLSELANRIEAQRTVAYTDIFNATEQEHLDKIVIIDKELADHKSLITNLATTDSLWLTKLGAI